MSGPKFKPIAFDPPPINNVEPAPIVNKFDNGAVFKGSGNSHFTCDNGKFHETTEIPGLKQGIKISTRFDIENP